MIKEWLYKAKKNEDITHVLIINDAYDRRYYPREVAKDEDVNTIIADYEEKASQTYAFIKEVFNMAIPIEDQLKQDTAWNIETPAKYIKIDETKTKTEETLVLTPDEIAMIKALRAAQNTKG